MSSLGLSELAEGPLFELAEILGNLPGGDVPGAWYASMDPGVLSGYERFAEDTLEWNERYAALLKASDLPADTTFVSQGGRGALLGLVLPPTVGAVPRWWRRQDNSGYLIPRKRTRAEKASEVNELFKTLVKIPQAISYLPGMPNALWCDDKAFLPQVRRPAQAVLVFLAVAPEQASEPFTPSEAWQRMKISLFHLLRERQDAADQVL